MTTEFQAKIGDWVYQRFHTDYLIDDRILQGKRVLIVGSSASVEKEVGSLVAADFDLIIKFNSGVETPLYFKDGWTARTDILFSEMSGSIAKSLLLAAGVKNLVARVPEPLLFHKVLKARLSHLYSLPVGFIPIKLLGLDFWGRLTASLAGYAPTSGLAAICWTHQSLASQIVMVGFSFYKEGYRSNYRATHDANCLNPSHNPEYERRLVNEWIERDSRITVGPITKKFLSSA